MTADHTRAGRRLMRSGSRMGPAASGPTGRREAGTAALVVLLGIGIALLLVGGLVAAVQISDEGPQTPQAAVEKLLDAASDGDLLGVLESLLPGERESFGDSLEDLADELRRLEIASSSLDLGDFSGFELEFAGLEYDTEELRDDLAVVRLVGGTVTTTVDPARLPAGSFILDLAGDEIRSAPSEAEVTDITADTGGDGFATVNDGGTWYVSLWYSVAEAARAESGLPPPDPSRRLEPAGSGSAEEAAEAFVRALATADLRRVFELFPPDEARALHDYAPLFIDELEAAGAEFRALASIEVRSITAEAERRGSRTLVRLRDPAVDVVLVARGLSFTYEDGCVEIREIGFAVGERICPGDDAASGAIEEILPPGVEPPDLTLGPPELGLVAVERGGEWFISPTRTVLDNITAVLRVFDRADLDELRRFGEDFFEALAGGFFDFGLGPDPG